MNGDDIYTDGDYIETSLKNESFVLFKTDEQDSALIETIYYSNSS